MNTDQIVTIFDEWLDMLPEANGVEIGNAYLDALEAGATKKEAILHALVVSGEHASACDCDSEDIRFHRSRHQACLQLALLEKELAGEDLCSLRRYGISR